MAEKPQSQSTLDAAAILAAEDQAYEYVPTPEWGGPGARVRVKALSGTDRDVLDASMIRIRGKLRELNMRNLRARACVLSIVDEQGNRVFNDNQVEALGRKNGAVIDRIFTVIQKLSGISDDDVEILTQELGNDQSASSGSDSPSPSATAL